MIKNKRGEEMVEAAIVLPLLILLILSLITVMLFYYSSLVSVSEVQRGLFKEINRSKGLFRIVTRSGGTEGRTKGLVSTPISRGYSEKGYVMDMGEILRLRRLAHE